jgi:hypothetical protein
MTLNSPDGAVASLQNANAANLYAPSVELVTNTAGTYKVRLTATDAANNMSERLAQVVVYADACAAAQAAPGWAGFNPMDFNQDCTVNLADLAAFSLQWLDDRGLAAQVTYSANPGYQPLVNGIINGNFETGTLLGYYNENVVITEVDPIEGIYSAEWTVTGGRGGIVTYRALEANTSYVFSVQIIGGSDNPSDEFFVRRGGSGQPVYATASANGGWTPSETLQTVTIPFETLEEDGGVTFEFVIFSTTDDTYYKVDDLRLVKVE